MPTNSVKSSVRKTASKPAALQQPECTQSALAECVGRTVRRYLTDMGDTACSEGLYALVLRELEVALLQEAMAFHDGNQSRTADVLGINRATLHKKLALHGLI